MVHLRLLGPPEAFDGRSAVPLAPKLLALLAYVAVAAPGRLVRRDVLLATFWPDSDVDSARNALNQAVYELRRHLGPGILESRGKAELAIGPTVSTDVRELRALLAEGRAVEALELYRGDLLEGLRRAPSKAGLQRAGGGHPGRRGCAAESDPMKRLIEVERGDLREVEPFFPVEPDPLGMDALGGGADREAEDAIGRASHRLGDPAGTFSHAALRSP